MNECFAVERKIAEMFPAGQRVYYQGQEEIVKMTGKVKYKDKIRLEWREEPYYGKNTDRMFASLDCKVELSEAQQQQIIKQVNQFLHEFRTKYHNLPFTNYRDNNRKRVGFDFIYKLCSKIYSENF